MVDKLLTAASESTTEHVNVMQSAIPLHQPSAASLNSDDSSKDLIYHPSTTSLHSDDSSTGPLCHFSTVSFSYFSSQSDCTLSTLPARPSPPLPIQMKRPKKV